MLCSLQLNGLVSSLKKLEWSVGKEFEVVTVILDPAEKQERSKQTKTRYLKDYERPNAASGWTFLTGKEQDVRELANSVGFQYGYNEARGEYVHPAAIALLSPEGVIARYLYGIEFHPETLRLGLVEASEGKIGSSFDRLVLFCFHYDATEGRYAPVAMNIMRLGAASVALALGIVLGIYWIAEMRKRKAQALSGAP